MTDERTLPEGWRWIRFGDVVRQVKETTKDPESDGLTRIVGLEHLDSESLPLRRWHELDDLPDGTSFTRVFRAGQVLFGKRRAYQRKVAVADFDGVCSGDILVFEPSADELLPEFLPYLVQSDAFFDHALGTSAGSLSPRTSWKALKDYGLGLPSADEQRSVSQLLDIHGQARQAYEAVLDTAVGLLTALRYEAARTSESARGVTRLDALADVVDCEHKTAPEGSGPFRLIGTPQVREGRLDLESARSVDEETFSEWTSRAVPEPGDMVFTREAPVGEVGIVPENAAVCLGQRTVLLQPKSHRAGLWLYEMLQEHEMKRTIEMRAAGTTNPHLNVGSIRGLAIPTEPAETSLLLDSGSAVRAVIDCARASIAALARSAVATREQLLAGGDGV